MTDADDAGAEPAGRTRHGATAPYVPVTLLLPSLGAALGIDGGPIFQIVAVEDLGLSPAAIGFAFGCGVASLPLQIYAARIPVQRARVNVQLFLALAAVQAWILAALVGTGASGGVTATALAITVAAEISLSVLFATAWQPLLYHGVGTRDRQRLNTRWAGGGRAVLAGTVVLFASVDAEWRSALLIVIGIAALLAAVTLARVDSPAAPPPANENGRAATTLTGPTRVLLLVFAVANLGALPLWLVYLNRVLWPDANLGVVTAVQTVAAMLALLAWRPTSGTVIHRALVAAMIGLLATAGLVTIDAPVDHDAQRGLVLVATALLAATTTTSRLAMLESAHRVIPRHNTVKAFTWLDVVASTSLQAGLLLSGFLVTASVDVAGPIDPYRAFVLACALLTIPAIAWFRAITSSDDPQHSG